jgi:branched-subunit amino acid aminotransferase/4-amino-4-deoxychorismate lyase
MMELDGLPVSPEKLAGLGLRNYGHFTSMRVENSRVRGLRIHLERLTRDCRILHDADLDTERVRHLIRRVAGSAPTPVVVRVTVFDPHLDLGNPGAEAEPHVLISTRAAPVGPLPALRLKAVRYQRELPTVKHTGLFGSIYHRRTVQLEGYDDVLFLDPDSHISEGATWNIGFFDGSQVIWPKSECLAGVTRGQLQQVLEEGDLPSITSPVGVPCLGQMQGAFITNAAVGVRSVASIDKVPMHPDLEVLKTLQEKYTALPGESL